MLGTVWRSKRANQVPIKSVMLPNLKSLPVSKNWHLPDRGSPKTIDRVQNEIPQQSIGHVEMAFFGRSLKSKKIEIDPNSISSDSPEMQKRLDRIEGNYDKLDDILTHLETRFELDDRLATAYDESVEKLKKKPR